VAAGFFQKLGRLPFKCRRRISSGIQRAEMIKMVGIAVKVPPEDIQRHLKGRNESRRQNRAKSNNLYLK
jgi:hypothetical protein